MTVGSPCARLSWIVSFWAHVRITSRLVSYRRPILNHIVRETLAIRRCIQIRGYITHPGTFYMLPEASDADAAPYTVDSYELTEDAAAAAATSPSDAEDDDDDGGMMPFRLESRSRHDSSYELRLVVTRPLDREVRRQTHSDTADILRRTLKYLCLPHPVDGPAALSFRVVRPSVRACVHSGGSIPDRLAVDV